MTYRPDPTGGQRYDPDATPEEIYREGVFREDLARDRGVEAALPWKELFVLALVGLLAVTRLFWIS